MSQQKCLRIITSLGSSLTALLLVSLAWAETVTIEPSKDNTIYESAEGALSNGSGAHFFAGRNGAQGGNIILRGLLSFDIASVIPAGSTIQSVQLTLNASTPNSFSGGVTLHRVMQDWGEGTSDAATGEAGGALASSGDATWIHTFSPELFWEAPGGDFDAVPSARVDVEGMGTQIVESTAELVQDVQDWLDRPVENAGWLLRREDESQTAIRFDSGNNPTASVRPILTIEFAPPVISPASGLYYTTQTFDLVILIDPGESTSVNTTIFLDGVDTTVAPGICTERQQGITAGGLMTVRCPGVSGTALGAGAHTLSVNVELGDGTNPAIIEEHTVTWFVQEVTEMP